MTLTLLSRYIQCDWSWRRRRVVITSASSITEQPIFTPFTVSRNEVKYIGSYKSASHLKRRSGCPQCAQTITAKDSIPLDASVQSSLHWARRLSRQTPTILQHTGWVPETIFVTWNGWCGE